jgi:hypothetical protein
MPQIVDGEGLPPMNFGIGTILVALPSGLRLAQSGYTAGRFEGCFELTAFFTILICIGLAVVSAKHCPAFVGQVR